MARGLFWTPLFLQFHKTMPCQGIEQFHQSPGPLVKRMSIKGGELCRVEQWVVLFKRFARVV